MERYVIEKPTTRFGYYKIKLLRRSSVLEKTIALCPDELAAEMVCNALNLFAYPDRFHRK